MHVAGPQSNTQFSSTSHVGLSRNGLANFSPLTPKGVGFHGSLVPPSLIKPNVKDFLTVLSREAKTWLPTCHRDSCFRHNNCPSHNDSKVEKGNIERLEYSSTSRQEKHAPENEATVPITTTDEFAAGDILLEGGIPSSPLDSNFLPLIPFLIARNEFSTNAPSSPRSYLQRGLPRQRAFEACGQKFDIPIGLLSGNLSRMYKINEGVFGEVYSGQFGNDTKANVFKIVPIEGVIRVNGEKQKSFEQIETEIKVSQRLNTLAKLTNRNYTDGFCYLYNARFLYGAYPVELLMAWKEWHLKCGSENDCPRFDNNQLYAALELENAGVDVESHTFANSEQTFAVFLQIAYSLAVAEKELCFEHRDLHWGNVLVSSHPHPWILYKIDGADYHVPSGGLKSCIIDFTLSRCNDEHGKAIFDDLKNEARQFCGTNEYQYDIYRMMKQDNRNNWEEYHSKSNIFWLHYFSDKLIAAAKYCDRNSDVHLKYLNCLQAIHDNVLSYESCADFVACECYQFSHCSPIVI